MISIEEMKNTSQIKIIEDIANKIWTDHYVPIVGKNQVEYMLSKFQSAEAIKRQIDEGYRYFLILLYEKPAGYFSVLPKASEKSMFLSKLYIEKELRGRGIAKTSVSYIEEMCKKAGLGVLWLTVNKNNTDSIKAYEKMGFFNAEAIVQDIGGGFVMDDYLMRKRIV
jgi:diamine N-acetyltransferase